MFVFFFFKQKPAYEIKECDWSSDVCSSDLPKVESGRQSVAERHEPSLMSLGSGAVVHGRDHPDEFGESPTSPRNSCGLSPVSVVAVWSLTSRAGARPWSGRSQGALGVRTVKARGIAERP